jgi:lipopolysaccharide/colanic/teichoic acid biosynthesis glycosyltransferase
MIQFSLQGEAWIKSRRKRLLDLALLACLSPFALIIAVFAFLLSALEHGARNVFFTQERVGHQGKVFTIHKIRTMHVGTSTQVTPAGEFLNVLGADETPQLLWTIWQGHMSLIGPRPLILQDFQTMKAALGVQKYHEWRTAYTACRPGWMSMFSQKSRTFVAQSPEYLQARHYYDTYYHRHACFWVDIVTLFKSLAMWCTPPSRIIRALQNLLIRR